MAAVDIKTMPSERARLGRTSSRLALPRDEVRARIRVAALVFTGVFVIIIGKLFSFGLTEPGDRATYVDPNAAISTSRPDLVDRRGEILAADISMASLFAEPRNIIDPDEAAELISSVLPELDARSLRKRLSGTAGFAWIKREITPTQREQIHDLGIPGVGFLTESRRFYPGGSTAAHLVGLVDIDNKGIAGFEKTIDDSWLGDLHAAGFARGEVMAPVPLSVDLRVQHILHDELSKAMERYSAIGASGVVLDVHTGEVLAMVSLPDYDPNNPFNAAEPDRLNRMVAGVYELGSVFKSFTFAMALDAGVVTMEDTIDATRPIRVGRFTINDFHAKRRVLTVPEVFIYSSNIGAARMALKIGPQGQRAFLKKLGMLDRVQTNLPETARPIVPKKWTELTAMTVAFGHGLAVAPLQIAVADAALVNGGMMIPPTFTPRTREEAAGLAERVIQQRTSDQMRFLLRLNVEKGSGRRANVEGYMVGGKTGTAEKVENGRYSSSKRLNSFLAAFPMDDPQYVVLVVLDEPKAAKEGGGSTAGSNAAPTVGAVIRRSAALLGVTPRSEDEITALLVSN
ncbi:MAG: peptidoglycan D,D-transpeptidase FtsI family protein [Alphaproteobacteria bacterium]